MNKTIVQCTLSTLTNDEIIDIVDPFILDKIKMKDEAPEFRAYIIAESGTISPVTVGRSSESVTWTDRAVRQLSSVVARERPKLFAGHTKAINEDQARQALSRSGFAEAVGTRVIRRDDKAQAVIAAYWHPEHREEDFGSVSIEVEYELKQEKIGDKIVNVVDRILNVFGIALLDDNTKPAFANARKVGIAYAQESKLGDVSFQELVNEIKKRNFHLWQITTPEAVVGREIKDDAGNVRFEGGDREFSDWILKRENRIREELVTAKNNEIKALQGKINEFEESAKLSKANEVLGNRLTALPSPLSEIIKQNSTTLNVTDDIDRSVDDFISPFVAAWEAVNGAKISLGDNNADGDTVFGVKVND